MSWKTSDLKNQLRENPQLRIDPVTINSLITSSRDQAHHFAKERALQAAIIAEVDRIALVRPEYAMIFAVPNGQYRPGQAIEPGIRAGYPDLAWDIARGSYHGLRLELKVGKNQLSDDQARWAKLLTDQGYYVAAIWDSLEQAMDLFDRYFVQSALRP